MISGGPKPAKIASSAASLRIVLCVVRLVFSDNLLVGIDRIWSAMAGRDTRKRALSFFPTPNSTRKEAPI